MKVDHRVGDYEKWRPIGDDLKVKVMKLTEAHAASENWAIVFSVFAELALSLCLDHFGAPARKMWIGAFDHAQRGREQ